MRKDDTRSSRKWDERYDATDYAYGDQPNQFLTQAIEKIATQHQGKALCLAEGEGRNAVFLASLGYEVVAMDQSAVGLEKANRLAADRQVDIVTRQADLNDYEPEPNTFDLITMIWAHTPKPVRLKSYEIVKKGLKRGGYFILEGYLPSQSTRNTGGPSDPEFMFTLGELRTHFTDFNIIIGRELTRNVTEGIYHTGSGDVVQLLALKL
ncbi:MULTISPECIES: class I SAM-dependent methyltransferase [Chromohalobacter]|uniref:class I SAM-dependent methyltransferase n=1 Tax=Chromohalobacter TaxID=42054 RepID=UPI00054F94E6|nr:MULTISPECIES: class I SAM-dependent methyltransferase [Chromohalobacter]MBZ5875759.1 class I SAM-dependent methyltransferase [Chromohalobacter salexigens]MDF9435939.1 class I SAM-dependent methyltransferase [Chromohalobacter israelensis]PWW35662.1 tellurite resistance protein TehB [Chromohalobacter salexigens]